MNFLLPFLYRIPGAFFAPVIHEFTKARVSALLGDHTPRKNGFISFNPFKFFEPIGFILMLGYQVGWGQPVPTSSFLYKNRRKGILITYGVPILVSLLVGMLAVFLAGNYFGGNAFLLAFGRMSIRLAAFNLIPVYPLAMSKMLPLFVSRDTAIRLEDKKRWLQLFLFIMIFLDAVEFFVGNISQFFIWVVSF
jgi:hypothetical protein